MPRHSDGEQRQLGYYKRTVRSYDDDHIQHGDEHFVALDCIVQLARAYDVKSILDVGAGTGRALTRLRELAPDIEAVGVEPSEELRQVALDAGHHVVGGRGQSLSFPDDSFDAVIATGVMHHVPDPAAVVREMMRVSSTFVGISDSNRFGTGRLPVRLLKLALYEVRLWRAADYVRTRGRMYMESEGDGIFYSYSVWDSLPELSQPGWRGFVIPTVAPTTRAFAPLASHSHGLLIGLKSD